MIFPKVRLISSEGEEFAVDVRVATASTLVRNIIEDVGIDDPVPLPNVRGDVLRKVLDYCEYHVDNPSKEIPKPLRSNTLSNIVCEWDEEFVNIQQELLFELMLAANYLDIKPLLDLSCAKVATMIKGKKAEEIRQMFNIENDFTPEEESAIREENKWCDDA